MDDCDEDINLAEIRKFQNRNDHKMNRNGQLEGMTVTYIIDNNAPFVSCEKTILFEYGYNNNVYVLNEDDRVPAGVGMFSCRFTKMRYDSGNNRLLINGELRNGTRYHVEIG